MRLRTPSPHSLPAPPRFSTGPRPSLGAAADLIAGLRQRAHDEPQRIALRFLGERNDDESSLDYGTLDRKARALALQLIARGARGQHVLVLHAPGLDYVVALFACFYAGAIAVPAYPPHAGRPLLRLRSMIADCRAKLALTSPALLERVSKQLKDEPSLAKLCWLAPERIDEQEAAAFQDSERSHDAIALLQYTSGSTSDPKGVMLSQAHFMSNVQALVAHGGLDEQDRVVSWLPPYHDMGLLSAILLPVITGTEAILLSPAAFVQQPLRWLSAIDRFQATISGGPNFAYDLCLRRITAAQRAALDLSSWRVAFCGAERVRAETVERFCATFAESGFRARAFAPCYGLAEATLGVSFADAKRGAVIREFDVGGLGRGLAEPARPGEASRKLVSSGRALPGCRVRIVNADTCRSERDGTIGEIWVQSSSVASGYHGQEMLSRRTFRARSEELGAGAASYLRTGDLGFLSDGELFVTGRIKDLIILHGVNHYPEDLEGSALQSHPRLRPAGGVALAVELDGEERLVIVHEVDSTRELPSEEVIDAIRRQLADEHQLAVHEVVLLAPGALAKTSSGKPRRHAIAAAYLAGSLPAIGQTRSAVIAATPASAALRGEVARAMAEVLGIEAVASDENFFELGGHSLLATQLVSRLRESLRVELPLSLVFESPTPTSLAARVARLPRVEALPPIQRADRNAPLPLSYSQERMWFMHQLDPHGSAYNVAGAVSLHGALDTAQLFAAFDEVLRRHEILRSNYVSIDGAPELRIAPARHLEIEQHDLSTYDDGELRARRLASDLAQRPFEIGSELLIRAGLYQLEPRRHVLCVSMHHLITDAWSMGILTREVLDFYVAASSGRSRALPELQIQYADYALWQRQQLSAARLLAQLEYWKAELEGAPALELPFDRPTRAARSSRGALLAVDLPPELFENLREFSRNHGVTLFMVMLSAFELVLHRYSGQTDIVLGVPIANRNHSASEGFMGTLVNTLALRVRFEPEDTFKQLLDRTRSAALGAYAHQDLPFERLVAELSLPRDTDRSPLIQAMFDFQNAPAPQPEGATFSLKPFVINRGASQFDLSVLVSDSELGRSIGFEYSSDRFSAQAIERLAGHYLCALRSILGNPEQPIARVTLLGEPEQRALLEAAARTSFGRPDTTSVHDAVQLQAERTPHARAVIDRDAQLSYAELEQRAEALAELLQARGIGRGDRVAVYLERSRHTPVALLGVLKTGAAYVPLDPRYPSARIEQVLTDADPKLVLTWTGLEPGLPSTVIAKLVHADRVPHTPRGTLRRVTILPDTAAYVIYTSGSTGRPKGVEVSHGGLSNFLRSMREEPGIAAEDVLLSVTTVAFDISGLELFLPLANGAAVYVASSEVASDGPRLCELLESSAATMLQATPATWKLLIEAGFKGNPRLKILCGGEAMPRDLANQLLARGASVWNLYGPTETTIWSTVQRVTPGIEAVPIGHAIAHTRLYVLDAERALVPFGAVGEIYIGGAGVANRYHNQPGLTAERFFSDPFSDLPGSRMYRTGDLGKLRADGTLEYLGRADHQIKLRGFRIEPGEIEALLKQQPAVRDAVVIAREDRPGDLRLVAYYVSDASVSGAELRAALAQRLPEYMVPVAFVSLAGLPQTPNGKLDRKRLPAPEQGDLSQEQEPVEPRDALEAELLGIWQLVLGTARLGVRDNFFAVGGHSLLAVRLLSRIRKQLGIDLPLVALLKAPTIELFARELRDRAKGAAPALEHAPSPALSFVVPFETAFGQPRLFCVHGAGGDVLSLRELAAELRSELAFYGIQSRGVDGTSAPFASIEDTARAYLDEVRKVQSQGPYQLSGYCGGGLIAFEMAQQLRAAGQEVALLALIDSRRPGSYRQGPRLSSWLRRVKERGLGYLRERAAVFLRREFGFASARLRIALSRAFGRPVAHELRNAWLTWAFFRAEARYSARHYDGQLTLLRPAKADVGEREGGPEFGWRGLARQGIELREIPGNHDTLLKPPHVAALGEQLKDVTRRAIARKSR